MSKVRIELSSEGRHFTVCGVHRSHNSTYRFRGGRSLKTLTGLPSAIMCSIVDEFELISLKKDTNLVERTSQSNISNEKAQELISYAHRKYQGNLSETEQMIKLICSCPNGHLHTKIKGVTDYNLTYYKRSKVLFGSC